MNTVTEKNEAAATTANASITSRSITVNPAEQGVTRAEKTMNRPLTNCVSQFVILALYKSLLFAQTVKVSLKSLLATDAYQRLSVTV